MGSWDKMLKLCCNMHVSNDIENLYDINIPLMTLLSILLKVKMNTNYEHLS